MASLLLAAQPSLHSKLTEGSHAGDKSAILEEAEVKGITTTSYGALLHTSCPLSSVNLSRVCNVDQLAVGMSVFRLDFRFRGSAACAAATASLESDLERLDMSKLNEIGFYEDVDEQIRITGSLQNGVVQLRRSALWVCFGGGARPQRARPWKTKTQRASSDKARNLVQLLSRLPSGKEEVYGGLDAWAAWELEFPIATFKTALKILASENHWKRVIQATKWMLSKGQGKTIGTYALLLQALDYEGRVEEADTVWEKILTKNQETIPRYLFTIVLAMFERHRQPRRLLQVFADMEDLEIRPDPVTVERVARTYRGLGLTKRADLVEAKYQPPRWEYRFRKGKRYRIKVHDESKVPVFTEASQLGKNVSDEAATELGKEEDVEDSESDAEDCTYELDLEEVKSSQHHVL